MGNRIALSSTSGACPLFPTRPKWAVGKHLGVLKKSQCHPDVSQSLSPLLFGKFPGAKRLFSAPGRRKNRLLGAERPVFAPGDRKKVARGKSAGICPWQLWGAGAVRRALAQTSRSRPRLMSGRGPPQSGGRDGAKRRACGASRPRTRRDRRREQPGRGEKDRHPQEQAYSKKNRATPVIEMQTPRISFGVTFCL